MLKAIYSSKMYRSSRHKDRIKSAIANPINSELVQQLKEYLDEDDVIDKDELERQNRSNNSNDVEEKEDDSKKSADSESYHHSPVGAPSKPVADNFKHTDESHLEDDEDDSYEVDEHLEDTDDQSDDIDDSVENSTTVGGQTIEAQTALYTEPCNSKIQLSDAIDEIKGILNSRQDTCGVNRVLSKESELWIYYEDKINLNNVMGPAIELINAANYTYLDFNRLARSDNAMVFQINLTDSNSEVAPIGDVSDESKK